MNNHRDSRPIALYLICALHLSLWAGGADCALGGKQANASAPARPDQPKGPLRVRQVLVPLHLAGYRWPANESAQGEPYSPNHRGPGASLLSAASSTLGFGQRRRSSADSQPVGQRLLERAAGATGVGQRAASWSQPDPRRAFSLPVSLLRVPAAGQPQSQQPQQLQPQQQATRRASGMGPPAVPEPAARPADGGPMLALVRYVPVIMSLPAEQVLQVGPARARKPVKGLVLEASEPSELGQPALSELAGQSSNRPAGHELALSAAGDTSADFSQAVQAAEPQLLAYGAGQAPTRLAYLQPVGQASQLVPASHAASRALSAYASRLISMLRPSVLLSSIGAGYSQQQQQQQQQQRFAPQIYLLAPAESLQSLAGSGKLIASASQPASNAPVAGAKPDDLLMNQASRMHPTKYQQQQQQQWSPSAQQPMSGLICIQGLIGKQAPATGQNQVQQQSDDSFDYDRPSGGQDEAKRQVAGSKGAPDAGSKGRTAPRERQRTGKESPARQVQRLAQKVARQRQHDQDAEPQDQQDQPMSQQQRLLGLSSEGRQASVASLELESGGSGPSDGPVGRDGRPIIPFTIQDKIDNYSSSLLIDHRRPGADLGPQRYRSGSGGGNAPVQYDEPAEGEHIWSAPLGSDGERRAKTTFAAGAPKQSWVRPGQGQIDYRKEPLASSSLPILMASSAAAAAPPSQRGPQYGGRVAPASPSPSSPADDAHTVTVGDSAAATPAFMRPSVVFRAAGEPAGLQQAASSQQVATNTPAPGELLASARRANRTAADHPQLGRLISSLSVNSDHNMSRDDIDSSASGTTGRTTVELLVNSSPVSSSPSSPSPQASTQLAHTITASPLYLAARTTTESPASTTPEDYTDESTTTTTTTASTTTTIMPAETTTTSALMPATLQSPGSSFHSSHDRSLSDDNLEFSKISESLQTNPLDLIDLQNSRSSFELPAQLESLSMLVQQPAPVVDHNELAAAVSANGPSTARHQRAQRTNKNSIFNKRVS